MTQKYDPARFDAPPASSPETAARIGTVRAGAARGQTLSEALQALGVSKVGDKTFDVPALEIGERIRYARQRAGLTQAQLAENTGCKQADICNIERGKGRDGPTYRLLRIISEALGEELFIGPEPLRDQVDISTSAVNCVVQAEASLREYAPLLSQMQWISLRNYAAKQALATSAAVEKGRGRLCTLITLEPTTTATLHVQRAFEALVLTAVRGTGSYHVRGALHRQPGPVKAGSPMGVVQAGTAVKLTSDAEPLSVMMVPAGVLMNRTALANAGE